MTVEAFLFYVFAAGTVTTAALVVLSRNPVAGAMSLVASFFFLAGIYALLWAHTIAVLQVLVYAGAVMVLFLFVIMLLSLTDTGPMTRFDASRVLGALSALGLFGVLAWTALKLPPPTLEWMNDPARRATFGTIKELGAVMYTQWLFPFEAVSLLLLVAMAGAVVVAKTRI